MWSLIRHKTFILTILCGLVIAQKNTDNGDSDSMVFPGPISRKNVALNTPVEPAPRLKSDSELSKSLQLAKKINSMNSLDEFFQLVKGIPEQQNTFSLHSRLAETGERSNAERAIPAKCMPELQPVSLKQENDPSTIYYPSCTRVKRCGGCCNHALLSCQPTASVTRNFEVYMLSIDSSNLRGKRIVPIEEHTECQCDCKIKEEHCNEKQSYIPAECRCMCNNVDEEEKCSKNNDTKLWDQELCACLCRGEQECSTGFYFDQNMCRCRQVPLSRGWFPSIKATGYGFGQTQKPDNVPPIIIPLDAGDPRRKPKPDPDYK